MPKFQYNAVNKQGRNLNGIIEADTEQNARRKLNNLRLSVIAITQITTDNSNQELDFTKYKFEARDKEQKKVAGTIAARDLLSAFSRLVKEYELKVIKLAGISATEKEFEASKDQVTQLYAESEKLSKSKKTDRTKEIYVKEQRRREFQSTIEDITITIRAILNEFDADLRPEAKEFLSKYLQHIEKIKHSENFENILSAALKVLNHIERAELFLNESKDAEAKLKYRLQAMHLASIVKQRQRNSVGIVGTIFKMLNKVGVQTETKKMKPEGGISNFANYFKIIFSTKSQRLRKQILFKILQNFGSVFKRKPKTQTNIQESKKTRTSFSKYEILIFNVSTGLLIAYLSYYFLSIFVSQKILTKQVHGLLYTYNTSLLIYIIIAVIFIHSSIRLRSLLDEHKIKYSKIPYTLFSILYLLIIINL